MPLTPFDKAIDRLGFTSKLKACQGYDRRDLMCDGDYQGIVLEDVLIENVYFDLGGWSESEYRNIKCQNNIWAGSLFYESLFESVTFHDCLFYDITAFMSRFIECRFEECNFQGCNFNEAVFDRCDFKKVSFTRNNLGGECTFARAVFQNNVTTSVIGFPARFPSSKQS